MTTNQRSTVVGVFHERDEAREAIDALKAADFAPDSISILTPDKQATQDMAEETGTHAGSGAATGAVTGGILGGLGGWLVGIGALAIPGIGPFIAAGAFASALGGAAIGAGVGAVAGALVGMGVPKEEAEYYEGEVKSGRTLVTVNADGRYDDAKHVLRQHGAYDIESKDPGSAARTSADSARPRATDGEQTLELREEELQARKQTVQTGEVRLGKEVVSEQRTVEVPTTREEVFVERHAVQRPADRPISEAEGQTIQVPVHEERVEVDKSPVVYEEVDVGKRQVVEKRQVSETVRREEARIEHQGDVDVRGAPSGSSPGAWEQAMPRYRTRWQRQSASTGSRWEDVEPGYRYGWETRNDPRYRGRSWSEVESDVQRDWTARHPGTPWERARDSVRESWQSD